MTNRRMTLDLLVRQCRHFFLIYQQAANMHQLQMFAAASTESLKHSDDPHGVPRNVCRCIFLANRANLLKHPRGQQSAESAVPVCTYLFILLLVIESLVFVVCCRLLEVTNDLINWCKCAVSLVQKEVPTDRKQLVLVYQYFFLPSSLSLSSSSYFSKLSLYSRE